MPQNAPVPFGIPRPVGPSLSTTALQSSAAVQVPFKGIIRRWTSAWYSCVQSGHDASEVGEIAVIEHVAEDALQESVMAWTGPPHQADAVGGDGREGRAGIVGIGLSLDETGVLHAVEELRQSGRRQDQGLCEVAEPEPATGHVEVHENVVTRHGKPRVQADVELELVLQSRVGMQQGEERRHPPGCLVLAHVFSLDEVLDMPKVE